MKKYIWITLYLIWLVFLSFLFFLHSKHNNTNKITNNNISETKNTTKNNNKIEKTTKLTEKEKTWNTWSNISNKIDKELENKDIEIEKNTKEDKKEPIKKEKTELPEFLFIWLTQLNLQKDTRYEEIYNIINVKWKGIYKVEEKDIYLKPLDNNDYNSVKDKISKIINKIWWNVISTNLFWDKQCFINPDIYYKKQVIMLINFDWKNYLVVLPYKKYKNYKKIIKEKIFSK